MDGRPTVGRAGKSCEPGEADEPGKSCEPGEAELQTLELRAHLRAATAAMQAAGVPSPQVDARVLAEHVLGTSLFHAPTVLQGPDATRFRDTFDALVVRRQAREPLQHLTGTMHFRHLTLPAGPGVFVVRPETEMLVEHALRALQAEGAPQNIGAPRHETVTAASTGRKPGRARVVDLCTGSGAIALALATERPATAVWAVELEPAPAAQATASAAAHAEALARVDSSVTVVRADATDTGAQRALAELDGTVDVVVSNPPYIPPDAVPVDPEVREHDPAAALYGLGEDGLQVPRGVLRRARQLLRPGGVVLMEHADVQGAGARALAEELGYVQVTTLPDLTGRDRFLRAERPAQG